MDIKSLKENILNKSLDDSLIIFKCNDNTFIANEYIDAISKIKHRTITYVDDLSSIKSSDFNIFDIVDDSLYVFSCDKLEDFKYNVEDFTNVIIKCKSIDSKLSLNEYIVDVPKLENWQVIDYLKQIIPGVSKENIEWLCNISKCDVYRLKNEADKINLFAKSKQDEIFNLINSDDGYSDLSSLNVFTLTNALVKRDILTVSNVLQSIKCIDVEPLGVVTLLLKDFKKTIDIQLNANATAESLGMSAKQFSATKYYNCGKYSNSKLIKIYELLLSIDSMLKNGELDNDKIVDYIVINVLGE